MHHPGVRPGHHRPLGTVTWMRFPHWTHERAPELGDVVSQISCEGAEDADVLRRSYLIVGLEETRTGYRLLLERVEYGTLPDPPSWQKIWAFFNAPS